MKRQNRLNNARRPAGVVFLVLLVLAGCASTPPLPTGLEPRRLELDAVPFFAQAAYQCGPATLAMVMNYPPLNPSAQTLTPEQLAPSVYLPGRQGSLQVELIATARQQQRLAYVMEPRLDALLAELAAGRPLIVLQNLGLDWAPLWHYAVAIGYDLERGELLLRSGPERRQQLPLATFDRTWARGGRWALLVLPPGEMPATAEPQRYLAAASDLESTGQSAAALAAYAAAAKRWPDQLGAQIGAGNSAYRLGDFTRAADYFRAATTHHPDSAAAHNNLADTLLRLGKRQEALAAAQRAVALGGDQREIYEATLREIERAR